MLAVVSSVVAQPQALSVAEAVELALEANHQYLNLQDQSEISQLDFETARSVYKTKFGSSASSDARSGAEIGRTYSLHLNKRNESGSGYSAGFYSSSFGDDSLSELRFSYTLPFFKNPLDSSRLAIEQSEVNAARTARLVEIGREELVNNVVSSYLMLALVIRKQELAEQKAAIAEDYHRAQQIRYNNGEVSLLALTEAELAILDSRQSSQLASLERTDRENNFRVQLGLQAGTPVIIDVDVLHEPATTGQQDLTLSELESQALANRTEVLGKREEILMTSKKIESTKPTRIPPMEVSLQYALVGEGEGFDDTFDLNDQRFGVGFRMNTDFSNSESRIKRRKLYLTRRTQNREYDHLKQMVLMEVRKAHMERERSASLLDYSKEYLALATRKHEQSEILHRRGDITQLELLESNYRTMEAQIRSLSARVEYLLAEHRLAMTSGLQRY